MMRVALRAAVLTAALSAMTPRVWAVQPDELLRDPALEARARAISAEMRCVVCQNQSIDDSDAPLARDLRLLVRERLRAGDSDAAVRDFVSSRYGAFVLLKPPLSRETLLLWFGPAALALLGLGALLVRARRSRGEPQAVPPLSPDEQARVQALVAGEAEHPTGAPV